VPRRRPPPPPHVKPPTSSSTRRTKWDYYAKRLATCSSDRSIKVFDASGDRFVNTATLTGHEGPVWQVSWAHPKFGVILASCSYDGSVLIHREAPQHSWAVVYEHKVHDSSVNSISWAPHEYGLVLACASSDGKVSILDYRGGSWYVLCFFVPACVDPLYHLPRPYAVWSPFLVLAGPSGCAHISRTTRWVAIPSRGPPRRPLGRSLPTGPRSGASSPGHATTARASGVSTTKTAAGRKNPSKARATQVCVAEVVFFVVVVESSNLPPPFPFQTGSGTLPGHQTRRFRSTSLRRARRTGA
jgi:hypothetical protein